MGLKGETIHFELPESLKLVAFMGTSDFINKPGGSFNFL